MTLNLFGRKPKGRRRRSGAQGVTDEKRQKSPEPYVNATALGSRPLQSTAHIQPANPGWPGARGPYQHHAVAGVLSQPCLPSQRGLQAPALNNQSQNSGWRSSTNLVAKLNPASALLSATAGHSQTCQRTADYLNQGAALCDLIASKLNAVITSIDSELFSGEERDLVIAGDGSLLHAPAVNSTDRTTLKTGRSTSRASTNHFSKVWLYSNARLPPHLPPLKIYLPTYPLLCLAAQYSERVYIRPTGLERETHVEADWRQGTKAMVLKSIPVDDMNTVVFAIRGSQTFMDWAVNFRPAPSSPVGFLDDPGNLCHSGFLSVARSMVKPVASRLRALLEENPARSNCSLLITGHSAGGAVAALLYAHMMAEAVNSELNHLTGFFKRVHCITFGAPPVSLLPLQTPKGFRNRKSIFFSFINEGDPVPRADKAVVASLLKLYASSAPAVHSVANLVRASNSGKRSKESKATAQAMPVWNVPASTLSNPGRLVLLRERPGCRGEENVEACIVTDEQLRAVVFGDPVYHMMKLYSGRIETLATRAVTLRGHG